MKTGHMLGSYCDTNLGMEYSARLIFEKSFLGSWS